MRSKYLKKKLTKPKKNEDIYQQLFDNTAL